MCYVGRTMQTLHLQFSIVDLICVDDFEAVMTDFDLANQQSPITLPLLNKT